MESDFMISSSADRQSIDGHCLNKYLYQHHPLR